MHNITTDTADKATTIHLQIFSKKINSQARRRGRQPSFDLQQTQKRLRSRGFVNQVPLKLDEILEANENSSRGSGQMI